MNKGLRVSSPLQRRSMALADLREIKEEQQTTQDRARVAIEAYSVKSVERNDPRPMPVFHGRHLDVDAVLARSLPRVVSE